MNCCRELLWAVHQRKPIIVVIELDPKYGGQSLEQAKELFLVAYSKFGEWGLLSEVKAYQSTSAVPTHPFERISSNATGKTSGSLDEPNLLPDPSLRPGEESCFGI